MTPSDTDSSEDVPESLATVLEDSSDSQLREIINYAQQLLRVHPTITDAIKSRPNEELVRVEDLDAYTIAVVERPGETGEARGPFRHRVKSGPDIDDGGGSIQVALSRASS